MADNIFPEDSGFGSYPDEEGDWMDAAQFAQLAYDEKIVDYVIDGLDITADEANDTISITRGVARLTVDSGQTVFDASGDQKEPITLDNLALICQIGARSDLALEDDNGNNFIFLRVNLNNINDAEVVIETANIPPSDPYLLIGEADTSPSNSIDVTLRNRTHPVDETVQNHGLESVLDSNNDAGNYDINLSSNSLLNALQVDLFPVSSGSEPSASEGRIFYSDDDGSPIWFDEDNTRITSNETIFFRAVNNDSNTLNKGDVVEVTGTDSNLPQVQRTDATSVTNESFVGVILSQNVAVGDIAKVIISGIIIDIDLSSFNDGDVLFLSNSSGTLTTTEPDAPSRSVRIGFVLDSSANGKALIDVNISSGRFIRLTDTPSTYSGSGDYLVVVNNSEDGLDFTSTIDSGTF